MSAIRPAAVAGSFYPGDATALAAEVAAYLAEAATGAHAVHAPKAIIAPHAGYMYSGPVAASIYARLAPLQGVVRRVVLAGPAHRVYVRGAAPINGLLRAARHHQLAAELVDLRNSGDTAGTRDRVVGYGAFAFHAPPPGHG